MIKKTLYLLSLLIIVFPAYTQQTDSRQNIRQCLPLSYFLGSTVFHITTAYPAIG